MWQHGSAHGLADVSRLARVVVYRHEGGTVRGVVRALGVMEEKRGRYGPYWCAEVRSQGAGLLSRSLVNSIGTVVPLQGCDLDTITGQTQIGTFGAYAVQPREVLIDRRGAK